jgi:hypothetical protein
MVSAKPSQVSTYRYALDFGSAILWAVYAKYGDANKPIISTELGWTTTPFGNPAGKII